MAVIIFPARIKRQLKRIAIGLCFIGLLSQVLTAPKGDEANITPNGFSESSPPATQIQAGMEDETAGIEQTGYLNINICSEKELQSLPGIGKILAQRITRFRSEYGFERKEDLMFVEGIGPGKYDKLKMLITVK